MKQLDKFYTPCKRRRAVHAVKAARALKALNKLKFMLSLVEEWETGGAEMEFSELDAGKDTVGDDVLGVTIPVLQCLSETYKEIVGEFEKVLPYVEAVLKHSKR